MKFDFKNVAQVNKQLNRMAYVLKTGEIGERVFLKAYRNRMVAQFSLRAAEAREEIRTKYRTRTGEERKAAGGKYAGRDTTGAEANGGKMAKSFRLDPKTGSYVESGMYRFRYGFLDAPSYVIFQEYGTRNGIEGMNILMKQRAIIEDIMDEVTGSGGNRYDFLDIIKGDIKVLRRENFKSNMEGLD